MSNLRQFSGGILIAALAIVIVGASLSIAIAQNRLLPEQSSDPPLASSTPPPLPSSTGPGAAFPTSSPAPPPSPTGCPPPAGWDPYLVASGDTLESLVEAIGGSISELMAANCLTSPVLAPNTYIYLPVLPPGATPTATASFAPTAGSDPSSTPIPCGPPSNWIIYTVQPGDTLFSIAQAYYTTVIQLQIANCMGGSTFIRAGDPLYVPNVATRTPTPTSTGSTTPTPTPTNTATPTATVPASPTPTGTETPSQTPTATPNETASPTPAEPTATATDHLPSETPTGTSAEPAASLQSTNRRVSLSRQFAESTLTSEAICSGELLCNRPTSSLDQVKGLSADYYNAE